MAFSNWICSKSTKNMFVKIVHPGGHVELHDNAVLAAEIILRNPRCVLAHPHVFKQPWAIVAPETPLMPGQKYYVVPISTIRRLQRLSNQYSPSPVRQTPPPTSKSPSSTEEQDIDNSTNSSTCWYLMNKNGLKSPYSCMKYLGDEADEKAHSADSNGVGMEKDGSSCFSCMRTGANNTKAKGDLDFGEETRSTSFLISPESRGQTRKRTWGHAKGSPKRRSSFDHWQPSLASIYETDE